MDSSVVVPDTAITAVASNTGLGVSFCLQDRTLTSTSGSQHQKKGKKQNQAPPSKLLVCTSAKSMSRSITITCSGVSGLAHLVTCTEIDHRGEPTHVIYGVAKVGICRGRVPSAVLSQLNAADSSGTKQHDTTFHFDIWARMPTGSFRAIAASSLHAGSVFVIDGFSVKKISIGADGMPSLLLVAGDPTLPGFEDGPTGRSRLQFPSSLAFTSQGNLLVADTNNNAIRVIYLNDTSTSVITLAGWSSNEELSDGFAFGASLPAPTSICVCGDRAYAVSGGTDIRCISLATGLVESVRLEHRPTCVAQKTAAASLPRDCLILSISASSQADFDAVFVGTIAGLFVFRVPRTGEQQPRAAPLAPEPAPLGMMRELLDEAKATSETDGSLSSVRIGNHAIRIHRFLAATQRCAGLLSSASDQLAQCAIPEAVAVAIQEYIYVDVIAATVMQPADWLLCSVTAATADLAHLSEFATQAALATISTSRIEDVINALVLADAHGATLLRAKCKDVLVSRRKELEGKSRLLRSALKDNEELLDDILDAALAGGTPDSKLPTSSSGESAQRSPMLGQPTPSLQRDLLTLLQSGTNADMHINLLDGSSIACHATILRKRLPSLASKVLSSSGSSAAPVSNAEPLGISRLLLEAVLRAAYTGDETQLLAWPTCLLAATKHESVLGDQHEASSEWACVIWKAHLATLKAITDPNRAVELLESESGNAVFTECAMRTVVYAFRSDPHESAVIAERCATLPRAVLARLMMEVSKEMYKLKCRNVAATK